jgi:hypothetical protein
MRAHCGSCSGLMVLVLTDSHFWFRCTICGCTTPSRQSIAEADLDVVWVPAKTPTHGPALLAALVLVITIFACGILPPCGGYECTSGLACAGTCP